MTAMIRVWRSKGNGKTYTRAGIGYLIVWLAVLLSRIVFSWLLRHDRSFAEGVGRFMATSGINADGVTLFFVLMALVMVLVREIRALVRASRADRYARPEPVAAA